MYVCLMLHIARRHIGLSSVQAVTMLSAPVIRCSMSLDQARSLLPGLQVRLQYLREGRDGLYRPCSSTTEEARSSLVPIRTQLVDPSTRKPGFKLLTLRSRILNTELR